ncbi:MAG: hypothetical protein WBB27_16695 [Maribacter sp.]
MIIRQLLPCKYSLVLVLLFFLGIHSILGQEDYRHGYIVKTNNDTLFGQVSNRRLGPFGGLHNKIKFKGKGLKKRYAPKNLIAYEKGDSIYRTLMLGSSPQFLLLKSEGAVSHYSYYFEPDPASRMILDIDYLQKGNGLLIRATQGVFGLKRKRLASFFSDCPELVEKIENKEYKYVFQIVDFYNDWIANRQK